MVRREPFWKFLEPRPVVKQQLRLTPLKQPAPVCEQVPSRDRSRWI